MWWILQGQNYIFYWNILSNQCYFSNCAYSDNISVQLKDICAKNAISVLTAIIIV